MFAQSWFRSLKTRFAHHASPAGRPSARRPRFRPRLEALEDRAVPTVSPTLSSVLAVGSGTADMVAHDNAVDAAGNTYVTGVLFGPTDFDPAVVHADGSDILTPVGYSDAYIAKYGPDNTFQWARRMGGSVLTAPGDGNGWAWDYGWRVAADAGNVYVTGQFVGTADFGPYSISSTGSGDALGVTRLPLRGRH